MDDSASGSVSERPAGRHSSEQHHSNEHSDGSYSVTGAGQTVHFAPTRGRTSSWIAVVIMIVSFTVGGVGVALWNWWMVAISGAVFVLAFLGSLIGGIMDDVH